ncbi:MAG: 50S ribosomal protein L29 [Oligoflexia bacterium]|nr:50S ribosomal protein L29 [Oligoflexia bacterium]
MNKKELKGLNNKEMLKKAADLKEELFNLRLQNLSGSLEDTSKIKSTKKMIARLMTLAKAKAN